MWGGRCVWSIFRFAACAQARQSRRGDGVCVRELTPSISFPARSLRTTTAARCANSTSTGASTRSPRSRSQRHETLILIPHLRPGLSSPHTIRMPPSCPSLLCTGWASSRTRSRARTMSISARRTSRARSSRCSRSSTGSTPRRSARASCPRSASGASASRSLLRS